MAASFSEAELLEFLFLPGFSTAEAVTDISGRGVGLDAVQEMAKSVGGVASISTRPGQGLSIQLELPLTLSVLRTFVAEISGEPFAFPLTRIASVVKVNRADLSTPRRPAVFFARRRADRRGVGARGAGHARQAELGRSRFPSCCWAIAPRGMGWRWTGLSANTKWWCGRSTPGWARCLPSARRR